MASRCRSSRLAALALAAYNFPKIGTDYMPPLDEGSILDMPVTVPRVSVTQAADDLKARDALLRRFPEVEMIVGKAGRADTPTDPSPLDMVESVITLRPKEHWPKRKLRYGDAQRQTAVVLAGLAEARAASSHLRTSPSAMRCCDPATMNAVARFDETMREMVRRSDHASSRRELGPQVLREFIAELVGRWQKAPAACSARSPKPTSTAWPRACDSEFAPILAAGPGQEDVNRLDAADRREAGRREGR